MYKLAMNLGQPIPNELHAVSVSLPAWDDVKGYEEADPRVINAMQLGYPRFVYHPLIKKLAAQIEAAYAAEFEFVLPLPSQKYALQCVKYCGGGKVREWRGIYGVILPKTLERKAKEFWMHSGFIVSSRLAENILAGKEAHEDKNLEVQHLITKHLADISGAEEADIYLYPTGMAAIYNAFEIAGEGKTIQLGFPYVDTLKIQQRFGHGIFVDYDLQKFEAAVREHKPVAVFSEFPLNPLLTCIDLAEVSRICRANNALLIVDDTLGTWANADALEYVDIAVTSLTKFFSGVGNVTAGSLIISSRSPRHDEIRSLLASAYEDLLFGGDAAVLEQNSRDFGARIKKINENAEKLFDHLSTKNSLKVYYTKGNPIYEKYKKAGYGGIISLDLGSEERAKKFFDSLDVTKGPSLGTNYTLACPYTMLAHYYEREFAESAGVPFHLIRVSVGLEDFELIKAKFDAALA